MCGQLSGVLVLDKPAGISSARAVARVKGLLGAKKIGHTGTLDPFATGVLICCTNQATRISRFLLQGEKTYQAVMRLGIETDTQDATGQVTRRKPVPDMQTEQVRRIIKGFVGRQMQAPPVYAALKHEGKPLYRLARQGKPVQKPARRITVASIDVKAVALPDIHFEVTCSSGTYVRTLCADMGRAAGCGGHLRSLRRTANSGFGIDQAHTLPGLKTLDASRRQAQTLIPMAAALERMPTFIASGALLELVAHGRQLSHEQIPAALIQETGDKLLADHVKVLDAKLNIKAVLKIPPHGGVYDYCCVFN